VGQLLVVVSCTNQHAQLELIPGLLAGLFLLSPGAPVNNCRWASIQWTWDQFSLAGPAGMGGALCIDPEAASSKRQA